MILDPDKILDFSYSGGESKTMKIRLLMVAICSTLILAVTVSASVSVNPSRVEGKMPRGKTYENKFTIKNPDKTKAVVNVEWSDRTIDPLKKDWLKLSTDTLEIEPGETKDLTYEITIPDNSSGEYNAWVSFTGRPVASIMGAGVALRVSIPIYVAVSGTEQYDYTIRSVKVTNADTTELKFDLKNTGNVHIRPTGMLEIISLDRNNEKYQLPFNDIKWGIIPREATDYICKFKEVQILLDGKYQAVLSISAGNNHQSRKMVKEFTFQIDGSTGKVLEEGKTDMTTERINQKNKKTEEEIKDNE